ncbi:MAG: AMP-binding protein [Chloroflexi bacterium]|nr:AMP-binding protein [Chloroflexota bacterium]
MPKLILDYRQTIWQAFERVVRVYPDRLALVVQDTRLTYRQLGERVERLAAGLHRLGLRRGEKLAIVTANGEAFIEAVFAAGRLGLVFVPINPLLRPRELRHILDDAEAAAVVVAERVWGGEPLKTFAAVRADLPGLRHVIVAGQGSLPDALRLSELIAEPARELPPATGSPDDMAALVYTSGTTGAPKGSIHTHQTLLYATLTLSREVDAIVSRPWLLAKVIWLTVKRYPSRLRGLISFVMGHQNTTLVALPAYTIAGFAGVIGALIGGDCLVLMERFIPAEALRLIQQERITAIGGVPTMMAMMLRVPDFDRNDLSSVLFCSMGAAPVPPSLVEEIEKRIGCAVLIGFGTTEAAGGIMGTNPFLDSRRAARETIGKLNPEWEAKVVDDQRRPLPTGQIGELILRGPSVMKGYYKAPELTAQTIDAEGWYSTGDLATIDAKRYIRIVGRKKDMIIRGGQNIYPAELEATLVAHPQIRQAAIIGIPTNLGDERVLACLVLEPGASLLPAAVLDFCRGQLAPYKVPDEVRFLDELPMNPTGKVQKYILREMVTAKT